MCFGLIIINTSESGALLGNWYILVKHIISRLSLRDNLNALKYAIMISHYITHIVVDKSKEQELYIDE